MNIDDRSEQACGDRGIQNRGCRSDCGAGAPAPLLSRRELLHAAGAGTMSLTGGGLVPGVAGSESAARRESIPGTPLPRGAALRVQPALVFQIPTRQEKTSWRWYGGIQTMDEVHREAKRLQKDMQELAAKSDFPVQFLPLELVGNSEQAKKVGATPCDAILIFGACSYDQQMCHFLAASKTPAILFLRHRTEPHYCQHVSAHAIFLRHWTDSRQEPNMDAHDVAVDDYDQILWRLRALYGLKNARGTKMLAIGGVMHYSPVGTKYGEKHAQEVWKYQIQPVSLEEFGKRLAKARSNPAAIAYAERQTTDLLAQPNVRLLTERKSVFHSFMALGVVKELLKETGATNFGFGPCMGRPVIGLLDTPPCLILALANDEGYTAYCHTDLTHTTPGVLLRWIAGRPSFVCNTHFPHDGIYTVAHCAAPRKMNGKDYEPTDIMTHYESDYGAATKVHYPKGQKVTVILPALDCSKWQGFRAKIIDSPSRPACRSQMDLQIEGNWRRLLTDQVGFHAQVVYGDYLREVGYALKKLTRPAWENLSEEV